MLPDIDGGKVLDIGCASGDFLGYLLEQGSDFEAHGIDAFSDSVGDTRIQFKKSVLTDAGYPDNYFDCVMAWAVFEHLHHPKQYFEEVSRVLKPGKELLILVTNSESIYGRYAGTEDVPRHTYHFSRKTLSMYGRESGLRLKELIFNDDIFDGRGIGLFGMAMGRLAGLTWEIEMLDRQRLYQRVMRKIGRVIDLILFATHWEARLGMSGIMVARFVKD
jgi:SAM-dependent methyltransferase